MTGSERSECPGRSGAAAAGALPQSGRRFGPRFREGFPLARRAVERLRARPALAGAVLLLATLGFVSQWAARDVRLRRQLGADYRSHWSQRAPRGSFVQRWTGRYRGAALYTLVLAPAETFASPLWRSVDFVSPWMRVVAPARSDRSPNLRDWAIFAVSLIVSVLSALLWLVGLLGWIRDSDHPVRLRQWPAYWRRHYVPVAALVVLLGLWALLLALIARPLTSKSQWGFYVVQTVGLIPALGLMLAPFVIVGRGTAVIEGAKTSLRLLREHWPALLALFVIFRVGYEVLTLWNAVPGWPERSYEVWGAWLPMAWRLVVVAGDALLGLWLAHAFVELARAPVEVSTQA